MSAATQDLLILIAIFGTATLGLDLIVGYTGIFSINQALLFGIGAFTYAFCVNHLHTTSLLSAWALAVPVAAALSACIALVSFRVSGDYFIVASFGAQIIGLQVLYNWDAVSGGPAGVFGLPYPTLAGFEPSTLGDYLLLAGAVCGLAYLVTTFVLLSPYGRLLRALGEDEQALAAAGFDPRRLKLSAFILGGSLPAIAGVLYAGYIGIAQVNDYSLDISVSLLAMVVVGGAGRTVGGILGAALLVLIPHVLDRSGLSSATSGAIKQAVFGALLLAVVMFMPSGISGGVANGLRYVRRLMRRPSTEELR